MNVLVTLLRPGRLEGVLSCTVTASPKGPRGLRPGRSLDSVPEADKVLDPTSSNPSPPNI